MNVSKVYIREAYGPGNLGDDVLMLCVINILKKRFKESDIAVGVDHPQIARNFNPRIKWLHIKEPVKADLVVLGGGASSSRSSHRPKRRLPTKASWRSCARASRRRPT